MSHEGWGPDSSHDDARATGRAGRGRARRRMDDDHWWLLNGVVRFYGFVLLAGTKLADAVTTAIGVRFVPGIVELNPVADAVFGGSGTFAGLAVLSVATVAVATLVAEYLAVQIRRRFGLDRLALASKAAIYGALSILFGAVAVNNALLISEQVHEYVSEALLVASIAV